MVRRAVLGVFLFVAFWVLIALALFFVAIRGGLGGARAALQAQSWGARRFMAILFTVLFIGFGIAIPLTVLVGNHTNANGQVGGMKLTPSEKKGRVIFAQHCGVCHTLAGANTYGKVGPNLDQLRAPSSLVYNTIINGCIQNPPPGSPQACLGYGTMPAGVVQPEDAKRVAAFVAKVAGRE